MDIVRSLFSVLWLIISCALAGFVLWRKLRRERVDSEDKIFDTICISLIGGLVIGRLFYILFNFQRFGLDLFTWVAISVFPGYIEVAVVLSGLLLFWKLLGDEWKDSIEQVDYLSIGLSFFLFLLALGTSIGHGLLLVERLLVPQDALLPFFDSKTVIASILYTLFYGGLFLFLSNVERNYRTFLWYRARRRSAQTGFVVASFLIGYGLCGFLLSWLAPMHMHILGVGIDPLVKLLVMVAGFVILYVRSGRSFFRQS